MHIDLPLSTVDPTSRSSWSICLELKGFIFKDLGSYSSISNYWMPTIRNKRKKLLTFWFHNFWNVKFRKWKNEWIYLNSHREPKTKEKFKYFLSLRFELRPHSNNVSTFKIKKKKWNEKFGNKLLQIYRGENNETSHNDLPSCLHF